MDQDVQDAINAAVQAAMQNQPVQQDAINAAVQAALQAAQQNQPAQQPGAAPQPQFGLTPGRINPDQPIDYSTRTGQSFYQTVTESLKSNSADNQRY